jgi:SOUL heme-binding protein
MYLTRDGYNTVTQQVRRYPPTVVVKTQYSTRPEGYAKLGAYADGSNASNTKVEPLSPRYVHSCYRFRALHRAK